MSRVRGGAQDADHVLGKADVQHLVGLIKHRNPDIVQSEGAALHVILNAPRRADDDLWCVLQRSELDLNLLAAV